MNDWARLPKPHIAWRIALLLCLAAFTGLDHNPVVRLEAKIGLSPSPIERLFGVKSLFSGMTEGVYQSANLNFYAAMRANIFSPFVIPFVSYSVLSWSFPRIRSRRDEIIFFSGFSGLSFLVNIFN